MKPTPSLVLRCGCTVRFEEDAVTLCPTHGVQGVARVVGMPPPRIRGVATGPHVETMDLPASGIRFAGTAKES